MTCLIVRLVYIICIWLQKFWTELGLLAEVRIYELRSINQRKCILVTLSNISTLYSIHSVKGRTKEKCVILMCRTNFYVFTPYWQKWSFQFRLISFTNFNAQLLYSLTIYMLHYNPWHISSINMPILRRTNCIITASGIVNRCVYSMPDDSRLQSSMLSSGIPYSQLQRVMIPDAVIIQLFLLKMGMLVLETCRGL